MQEKTRRCWSVAGLFAVIILVVYMVGWCLWTVLVDCNDFCCNALGEAGSDICGWLEPQEWAAAGEESDEEAGSLDPTWKASRKRSWREGSHSPAVQGGSGSSSARSGTRSGRAGGASGGSPAVAPSLLGKSRLGPRRPRGEIRVMRGGQVLHVGRSPAGVKRWARRHLQDSRGVMVVHSQSMQTPSSRKAQRSSQSPGRPSTPPSPLRPPSAPPSPLRPPPEPGPGSVRSSPAYGPDLLEL